MRYLRPPVIALVLGVLFLMNTSCQRHYAVTGNQYKEYGIDQQAGVDSTVVNYYLPYKKQMEAEMNRVLGRTEQALTKPSTPETLLGNYFADAVLTEGLKKDPTIQISFGTKGGLRTTYPQGDITMSRVFELMPFENELMVLSLTGPKLLELIDFIIKKDGEPVSGLRLKIKDKKPYDITIGGKPFDVNQTYKLITYDYLANGGDDLDCLRTASERKTIDKKVRDALIDNINDLTRQGKTINSKLDGRIVIE